MIGIWSTLAVLLLVFLILHGRLLLRMRKVEDLSVYDIPTGLLSGRYLETVSLPDAMRHNARGAILVVDLDRFAEFNANGYRDGGDRALGTAVDVLRRACRRATDRAFRLRLQDDEFVVLLPRAGREQANQCARGLVQDLSQAGVPGTIGVFAWDNQASAQRQRPAQALKIASELMKIGKRCGRSIAVLGNEPFVPEPLAERAGTLRTAKTTMRTPAVTQPYGWCANATD